jgi:NTE family protein
VTGPDCPSLEHAVVAPGECSGKKQKRKACILQLIAGTSEAEELTMPFGSEGPEEGIALALSGGGFRATLFHIGACWRLVELGVLSKLKRISSVSGGSIFAGVLATSWNQLRADLTTANYQALVVQPLRAFCRQSVDSAAIAEGALTPWESAGEHIENTYRSALFDVGLNQLPDTPIFVFNATNLQTGRSFRFSKPDMGDYLIGLIRNPTLPLAKARLARLEMGSRS